MTKSGIWLALFALLFGTLAARPSQAQLPFPFGPPETTECAPGAACSTAKPAPRRKARKTRTKAQQTPAKQAQAKEGAPAQTGSLPGSFERIPYTEEDRASAIIPGLPGVRFWADSMGAFADALPPTKGPWLILSAGGSAGAYGAGVLVGLSEAGKRPDFTVVTGVSIGAVMAPYAFLGQKYDAVLRDSFLNLTSAEVFEDAQRSDALVDTWPLRDLLKKRVTPQLLADIAVEHQKGRRLFVVTADLDSERPVVWNMGAIAAHGGEKAAKLFRDVLLAAAAIPGIFPPVYIDVQAREKKFQEMHVDGGVFGPIYVGPASWLIEQTSEPLPASQFYVLIHSKLTPEFDIAGTEKVFILGRTISAAVKAGAQAEVALLSAAAKRDGIGLNVATIDSSFSVPAQTAFDPKQMKAMYDLGLEQAKNGIAFRTQNPAGQAQKP
jgi:predicted acylesterase/phospholipase RssA